jgi:hypothetical protein
MTDLNLRELEPHRKLLSAMLSCGIRDSVYHMKPSKARTPAGHRGYHYKKLETDLAREQARGWMRDASMETADSTLGFGFVWQGLNFLDALQWELPAFLEEMEKLWDAVDKNPELGRQISAMIQALGESVDSDSQWYRKRVNWAARIAAMKEAA